MSSTQYGSPAELGEGLRRGEEAAADAFVRAYLPRIRSALRRIMFGAPDCEPRDLEDVSVDLAYHLIVHLGTNPVTNLRRFVDKAATRAGLDWRKTHRREFEFESGGDAAEFSRDQLDDDARVDGEIRSAVYVTINPEVAAVLEEARQKLTPLQQQLLDLRAQGYRYEEVALMLRDDAKPVKESTWRQRHKRALEALEKDYRRLSVRRPELERALDEAQRLARERKSATTSKEDA